MNKYERLTEFATTDRQTELITALIKTDNVKKAAKSIGINERGAYRMLKTIRKRQNAVGQGEHFTAMTNLKDTGLMVKGTSTLYKDGEAQIQWVKTDREAVDKLAAFREAIEDMALEIKPIDKVKKPTYKLDEELLNVYITNDLHFGLLADKAETLDRDYNLDIADSTLRSAIDYLVDNSPSAEVAIIADLGDTTEQDNNKNVTPHSGNALDVSSRYGKTLRTTMKAMRNLIEKALTKHKTVHFINISGNHDPVTSLAIRGYISALFEKEDRVIVHDTDAPQKYYQHGSTLLAFYHGDGVKMNGAGELMCMHNTDIWNTTVNRYAHFGHTHVDAVRDGQLCRSESHRNLAPLNSWAAHKGFGRGIGTMKAISYCKTFGEKSRNTFNVSMIDTQNKGK